MTPHRIRRYLPRDIDESAEVELHTQAASAIDALICRRAVLELQELRDILINGLDEILAERGGEQ